MKSTCISAELFGQRRQKREMAFILVPFNNLNDHGTVVWVSRQIALTVIHIYFLVFFMPIVYSYHLMKMEDRFLPVEHRELTNVAVSQVTHVNVCRITSHSKNRLREPALVL